MVSERSPTSATTTGPDDMASYNATDYTSTHTSPQNTSVLGDEDEWYNSKTPQVEQQHNFNYQQVSPDLDLLRSSSFSHSLRDHATSVRKSIVLSESMASVALHDIRHGSTERKTQLAMTNSPSFSALANILERKEAKFQKKNPNSSSLIVEEQLDQQHSSFQPSPLSNEQRHTPVVVQDEDSPNLIQFDDDDDDNNNHNQTRTFITPALLPSPPPPPYSSSSNDTQKNHVTHPYNTTNTHEDIFKTPDVPQTQAFPHQEYTSMLTTIESSPNPITYSSESEEEEEEDHNVFKPAPLPKAPRAPMGINKSPLLSEQYNQRSASMPVVVTEKKDQTKDKRRSFMNFFKTKRSVSSSNVPKKSTSFSIPSPSIQQKQPSSPVPPSSSSSSASPIVNQLKGSKSFTLSKSSTAQVSSSSNRPQAQRSASSNSLFSAFKRKKSHTVVQEDVEEEEPEKQKEPITLSKPVINIDQAESESEEDEGQGHNDTFSISSDEDFNEDFNNLNAATQRNAMISKEPPSQPPPQQQQQPLPQQQQQQQPQPQLPLEPIQNNRLSQISQGSKRYSQISQGETLFPKNLSAQDVESIVSLERNRSLSRQSLNSHRHSMGSVSNHYLEQSIPRKPSFESMSGASIQMSPIRFNANVRSPEYARRDYLSNDEEEEENGYNGLFNVEEFSNRLEFDNIVEDYTPDPEDMSSQFAEFADYIDFGDGLELNLGFDDDISSPLSQPALFNSSHINDGYEDDQDDDGYEDEEDGIGGYVDSPQLSQHHQSPLSSPFLQQSAYVPSSLQRPISMSFRGLKAPAFNTVHASDSVESFQSSQSMNSMNPSVRSQTASISSQPRKKTHNRRVIFSSKITVFDVDTADEYDRQPDVATCNKLTPQLAMMIRAELNVLKSEMEVHEDSRCYTHFL